MENMEKELGGDLLLLPLLSPTSNNRSSSISFADSTAGKFVCGPLQVPAMMLLARRGPSSNLHEMNMEHNRISLRSVRAYKEMPDPADLARLQHFEAVKLICQFEHTRVLETPLLAPDSLCGLPRVISHASINPVPTTTRLADPSIQRYSLA
jgi:hypothetical protein